MALSNHNIDVIINGKDNTGGAFKSLSGNLENAASASRKFGIALAGAATAVSVFGLKAAADMETAEIGLTTLLGSAEEAGATMERVKKEAARTPFELKGLAQAVQLLSSVTKDGDRSIDILLDVGEGLAAMGKGQSELDRIIVNLQQIAALGKASALDIKQFAFAGIPIYEMLQEQTGLAGEALGEFAQQGGVTFELLTEMFDKANDEGGRFFNAYINQTGSLNQLWSNLKDTMFIAAEQFVRQTGLFDLAKVAVLKLTGALDNLGNMIVPIIKWFREHEGAVALLVGAIVGALIPAVWSLIAAFAAGAIALAPWIAGGLIVAGILTGWGNIRDMFGSVSGQLGFLGDWINRVSDAIERKTGLVTVLSKVWKNVSDVFTNNLLPELRKLWELLEPLKPFLEIFVKIIGVMLYGALIAVVKILEVGLIGAIQTLTGIIQAANFVIEKFKNIWDSVTTALSRAIDKIDRLISKIKELNFVDAARSFVGDFLGFDQGGIVPGPLGSPRLVLAHGGETILPTHKGGYNGPSLGGGTVVINITGNMLLDQDAGNKIGQQIIRELNLNMRGV